MYYYCYLYMNCQMLPSHLFLVLSFCPDISMLFTKMHYQKSYQEGARPFLIS